jgi:hypothetical protein
MCCNDRTVIFTIVFVLCLDLLRCAPVSLSNSPAGVGQALGISPTSVQLSWAASNTAQTYQIFNLKSGSTPVQSTEFNQTTLYFFGRGIAWDS